MIDRQFRPGGPQPTRWALGWTFIEIPSAAHEFEGHGHNTTAREAVERAMSWVVAQVER